MAIPATLVVPTTINSYEYAAPIVLTTAFPVCRAIYVGTGGTSMTVTMLNGDSVVFSGPVAGSIIPIRATNVTAATVVSNLVALY